MKSVLVVLVTFAAYAQCAIAEPTVKISEGLVSGITVKTRKGREILGFRGIPYAEPPLGNLRLRNPVPKAPWTGVFKADEDGDECMQLDDQIRPRGSENCLTLNVYTPWVYDAKKPLLPVMAYIHGGGYVQGNSSHRSIGPDYLLDKDVVYVSMNYRLGVFGFISSGHVSLPGNFGMKDQVLALKWIQRNVRAFGGDPKRVTLLGESAGSGSVSLHTISEASKGLFSQYITQSGVMLAAWACSTNPAYYRNAIKLAEENNCSTRNMTAMADCIRRLPAITLLNSTLTSDDLLDLFRLTWAPTIEPEHPEAFITKHPRLLLEQGKVQDSPSMVGVVRDEGLLFSTLLYVSDFAYDLFIKHPELMMSKFLTQYQVLEYEEAMILAKEAKEFYLGKEVSTDKHTNIERFTQFLSDLFFFHPQFQLLRHLTKSSTKPIYFYNFDYMGTFSHTMMLTRSNKTIGVSHADELIYLFPIDAGKFGISPNIKMTEKDFKIVNVMVDLWTSFATTGVPASKEIEKNPLLWKPYSADGSILVIGNSSVPSVTVKQSFYTERMNFWYERLPIF